MPHELEYIVDQAVCHCDKGAAPNFFKGLANQNVKINGCMACTKADKIPLANIPSFGVCSITGGACTPVPTDWTDTYKVKIKGKETLLFKSKLPCSVGGKIEFMTSGQIPVSPEDLEGMTDEHSEEQEDEGWGWWDTAELIPVVGSIIGIVRSAAKGDGWMVAVNVGFLVMDVAGLVSFGATTAASTAAKGGLKAGLKVAGKAALKSAGKVLTKQGANALAKGVAKHVDDIAKATMKVCVFACFPAGTKVAVKEGYKNIEEVAVGDEVWAWDEDLYKNELRTVISTMENEVDATIELTIGDEIVETTAEHPFYTRKGWKEAADLIIGDEIKTRAENWEYIISVNFLYHKKQVYNFEVEKAHTYFVSSKELLVHNSAGVCVSKIVTEAAENIAKTWDDLAKFVHCFPSGTLVKIADGYTPIETIKEGDVVIAFDEITRENSLKKVLKTYESQSEYLCVFHIEDEIIECTKSHRLWSVDHNDWIAAGEIYEGIKLSNADGRVRTVAKVAGRKGRVETYNLEVEDVHTYYVSPLDILVHNGNPFANSIFNDLSTRYTEIYRYYDPITQKTQYIVKTVQGMEKRAAQHAREKALQKLIDQNKLAYEVIDGGFWNTFQTAAREQHYISKYSTKGKMAGAYIWNKINALSRKKFDYFSKIIKCP